MIRRQGGWRKPGAVLEHSSTMEESSAETWLTEEVARGGSVVGQVSGLVISIKTNLHKTCTRVIKYLSPNYAHDPLPAAWDSPLTGCRTEPPRSRHADDRLRRESNPLCTAHLLRLVSFPPRPSFSPPPFPPLFSFDLFLLRCVPLFDSTLSLSLSAHRPSWCSSRAAPYAPLPLLRYCCYLR